MFSSPSKAQFSLKKQRRGDRKLLSFRILFPKEKTNATARLLPLRVVEHSPLRKIPKGIEMRLVFDYERGWTDISVLRALHMATFCSETRDSSATGDFIGVCIDMQTRC